MTVGEMTREARSEVPAEAEIDRRTGGARRKLMFVIEALTVGGAEQMVVDLANEFAHRGDSVTVVCLTKFGDLAGSLASGISLVTLNKSPGIDFSVSRKLRALAIHHRIDVVNSHLWTANLWTRIALVKSGIPVVATEHNRDVWKKVHNRIIDRVLSHATAKLIAVSEDTADYYRQEVGVKSSLIAVVNNGVDTARYAAGEGLHLRESLADEADFLVGSVGRLAKAKNHPRLVAAADLLKQQGIPVRLVIAGEGPERAVTEAEISKRDLHDCVSLLGSRSDVPDILAALDVFVLSSDREGHPLSALEAQAAGTPVVLTNAGGSADAVSRSEEGRGGILVECTAEAIAESLHHLATHPEELAAMGVFAKAYAVKHYDKRLMIDRYSDLFDSVNAAIKTV